jgi:signal peptidase I
VSTEPTFKKSTLRDYYETLLVTIILLNFARIFAFQTFKIPTGSMEDNLKVGDHLVVNKFIFGNQGPKVLGKIFPFREIRRGDIIVFRFPLDPDTDYVKRVIGLPGDTVSVVNKKVLINGEPLDEQYTRFETPLGLGTGEYMPPTVVPEGHYFAMGDNRDRSYDSRFWGTVKREYIKGKPFIVYWSFRSKEASEQQAGSDRVKELTDVVVHFFDKTRWDRTFFIVDCKYHYHPEPAP